MMNSRIKALSENNNDFGFKQLLELEQKIDWDDLVEAIYPHYIKSKIKPILLTVENMLRIYILGHYFDISPSDVKKALFQVNTLRDFALIDSDRDVIPNESTIANFNSVIIEKGLGLKIEQALNMKHIQTEYLAAF